MGLANYSLVWLMKVSSYWVLKNGSIKLKSSLGNDSRFILGGLPRKLIGRLVFECRLKLWGLKWVHEAEMKLGNESSLILCGLLWSQQAYIKIGF